MALTCPHCGVLNRCDCETCNPGKDEKNLVIIDYTNECYQCYSCGQKFSEGESLDYDWDKMHEHIKNTITPKMCIEWRSCSSVKERKDYEDKFSYGAYGFESAFYQHFGIRHKDCNYDEFLKIKLMVEREFKINKII